MSKITAVAYMQNESVQWTFSTVQQSQFIISTACNMQPTSFKQWQFISKMQIILASCVRILDCSIWRKLSSVHQQNGSDAVESKHVDVSTLDKALQNCNIQISVILFKGRTKITIKTNFCWHYCTKLIHAKLEMLWMLWSKLNKRDVLMTAYRQKVRKKNWPNQPTQ